MKKNSGIIKLIALLILFPLIVWELSLKKTFLLYRENKQIEAQVTAIGNNRSNKSKPTILVATPLLSNGQLLEMMSTQYKECQVDVVSYHPTLINEDGTSKLYSGTLVLRGSFINLVKVIDMTEKKNLPAKLSSAVLFYDPSKAKGGIKIELTLIFQQVEG